MADPDYLYNPEDWEVTYSWGDRDNAAEDVEVEHCGIQKFATLTKGPDIFCVWLDNEYRWFKTRGEAEAAWKADAARTPQEIASE